MSSRVTYPEVRRSDTVDKLHGNDVADPYRWLEEPASEETAAFVKAQCAVSEPLLESLPNRARIAERLAEVYDYPKVSCPARRGKRLVYSRKEGLQNQPVVYAAEGLDDAKPRVLLDLNAEDPEGTSSLKVSSFSHCGELWAYGVSRSGSDWSEVRVKRVADGTDFQDDVLKWCRFTSIAWTHDAKGFFYARYPEVPVEDLGTETDVAKNQKVYYHRVGTAQSEDALVIEDTERPQSMFGVEVSDDGDYLVVSVSETTDPVNRFYYIDLRAPEAERTVVKAIDNLDAGYDYVTNDGTRFMFMTNRAAQRYRVVAFDLADAGDASKWTEVIPEHDSDVLEAVLPVHGDKLAAVHLHDVKEILTLRNMDGSLIREVDLPSAGSVGVRGRRDGNELFYHFTSFLYPGTIFHLDFETGKTTTWYETTIPGFNPSAFTAEQRFYSSRDGTRVPMYVIAPRDAPKDMPCLLYGYGGFSISITPYFSTFRTVLAGNLGVSVAIANIRGGGEYGEAWHEAGMRQRKQNVFDDFICAAENLIETGVTSSGKLAIMGGSNGGLLTAACVNQRPDLFAAVISQCPVMDLLRYQYSTAGVFWRGEYGTSDDHEDYGGKDSFDNLIKLSPVHNVDPAKGPYPAVLVTTADHDDRVCPWHSYKFIAEAQHRLGSLENQSAPLIVRIEQKAGHGAGKPTSKIIAEIADIYAFIAKYTGAQWKEPPAGAN